ncbi:MAG: DUF2528 family protein [Chlorobi bacterium]|nr:DUF2528 family protein [Chlorobiota bacterium]
MNYQGIQVFRIRHAATNGIVEIEINFNIRDTKRRIMDMVMFWDGWEELVISENGDFAVALCKDLAKNAILNYIDGFTLEGVINNFETANGWQPMDGSTGFRIVSINSEFNMDPSAMDIEVLQNVAV